MAENVIRQDIIQIKFDTDLGGLTKLTQETDKLKQSVGGGVDSGLAKITKGVNGLKTSVSNLGSETGIEKIKKDIETGGAVIASAKAKFDSFSKSVKSIATHPIQTLGSAVSSAANNFKTLASTKIENLKTGISNVKNALTEGETGAKGFTTALKNIGKISLAKIFSGGGIKEVSTDLRDTTAETIKFNNALKKIGGLENLENAKQDLDLLSQKLSVQKAICNNLADEYKKVSAELGETSDKALKLKANLLNQEGSLNKMTRESESLSSAIKDVTDGLGKSKDNAGQLSNEAKKAKPSFKEIASTSLTSLKNGLSQVSSKLTDIAKKAAGAAYNGLKKIAGISFKALSVGVAGAVTAVGALVTQSVSAYAQYEQLVGGVDTLFKDSSSIVQQYANNAYKTAGLSANAYMETVTSFSASLLQSLGGDTKKAAQYADLAISDMSDNANKMGTSMESIQYAYQGFAKQNYTMLDNLNKMGALAA